MGKFTSYLLNKRLFILPALLPIILLFCSFYAWAIKDNSNIQKIEQINSASFGFIENKGQIIDQNNQVNKEVQFLYPSKGINVQLRSSGFSYDVWQDETKSNVSADSEEDVFPHQFTEIKKRFHRIDFDFVNPSPNIQVHVHEKSKDYLNYFTTGTEKKGAVHVHHYGKIVYQNVWEKIDIEYILSGEGYKYDIIVHKGADINKIRIRIKGSNGIQVLEDGLSIATSLKTIEEKIPLSYYYKESTGSLKNEVLVRFKELAPGEFGFACNDIIPADATLIIDPTPELLWSTYYGGSGWDGAGWDIALDDSVNSIMTGGTSSSNNIATSGAHQATLGGSSDVFIVKFNAAGVRQWCTYYGGSAQDEGFGIALDDNQNIIVGGITESSNNISTAGAHQEIKGLSWDAFLAKFNSDGLRVWGTYYGGGAQDYGGNVAIDNNNNIFFTGIAGTEVPDTKTMSTPGAHQEINGGGNDGFLAKFNSDGTRLWSTCYGGSASDRIQGVATDAFGNVIISGYTASSIAIATPGAHQSSYSGGNDAFVAKFNTSGRRLWGTYYGGKNSDDGRDLAIDSHNNILLTGLTSSIENISSAGSHQGNLGGAWDAFVVKFTPDGIRQWGTYYGGSDLDASYNIGMDLQSNAVLITGRARSNNNIATANSYQPSLHSNSNYDAFIAKLDFNGKRIWGTYYGGGANDLSRCIAIRSVSCGIEIYIAGATRSLNFPTTSDSHQGTFGGGIEDSFLSKFSDLLKVDAGPDREVCAKSLNSNGPESVEIGGKPTASGGVNSFLYLWSPSSGLSDSTVANPIASPKIPTIYTVKVSSGSCTITDDVIVNVVFCTPAQECTANADFRYDYATPMTSNKVLFYDMSTVANPGYSIIKNWEWDFGDSISGASNHSTLQNPSHEFSSRGTYFVKLRVYVYQKNSNTNNYDIFCGEFETERIVLVGGDIDQCSVDAKYTWANKALTKTIEFYNLTSANYTTSVSSWLWNFGDGKTSMDENPQHTYLSPGVYYVCLMANGMDSSMNKCTSTFCDTVRVLGSPSLFKGNNNTATQNNISLVSNREDLNLSSKNIKNNEIRFKVFPNPFSSVLQMEINSDQQELIEINIYDLTGKLIKALMNKEIQGFEKIEWNLEQALSEGVYIYELKTKNNVFRERLVLTH